MLGEETITNAFVKIPLKTLNRHGLIAGATVTGKTKTLQVLAKNLSEKGTPTPLIRTILSAPMSRMNILTSKEIKQVLDNSD